MLDGLDAVAWAELSHAYGSAVDTPGLLRQAGSGDSDAALSELHGSIFHQGTVYPATVAAVPFLVELAVGAANSRDEFVWMLGMLADDRHAYGNEAAEVRTAVAAQREPLRALLDDEDSKVREAAAYAATRAGVGAEPLWRRWAVENDSAVRAALALALGEVDPLGPSRRWLRPPARRSCPQGGGCGSAAPGGPGLAGRHDPRPGGRDRRWRGRHMVLVPRR